MVDRITPVTTPEDIDRAGRASSASRTAGRWCASRSPSGCSRTTSAGGRPPFEDVGVQLVERRRALRADEAAAAQRQPPGAVLPRLPVRLPLRPRGLPGPAVRRLPARLHGPRGDPDAARRCPGSTSTPTSTSSSSGSPTPRSATPSPGCAPRAPTASPSGCCPVDPEQPRAPAARSSGRRSSSRPGRATPRASTSRASRSRSSTGSGTASWQRPRGSSEDPLAFIRDRDLFGDLVDDERFTAAYTAALDSLHAQGARATLESRASLDRPASA